MPCNHCFRFILAKFLLTHENVSYGKIVGKKSLLKVTGGLYC